MTPENERHLQMMNLIDFVGDNWRIVVGIYYLRDGFGLPELNSKLPGLNAKVVQSMDTLRTGCVLDIEYRLIHEWRRAIDEVTNGRPAVDQREVIGGIVAKAVALGAHFDDR